MNPNEPVTNGGANGKPAFEPAPATPNPARVSKRVGFAALCIGSLIVTGIGYGFYKRSEVSKARARDEEASVSLVSPEVAKRVVNGIPAGVAGHADDKKKPPCGVNNGAMAPLSSFDGSIIAGGATQQSAAANKDDCTPVATPAPQGPLYAARTAPVISEAQKRREAKAAEEEAVRNAPLGMKIEGGSLSSRPQQGRQPQSETAQGAQAEVDQLGKQLAALGAGNAGGAAGPNHADLDRIAAQLGYARATSPGGETAPGQMSEHERFLADAAKARADYLAAQRMAAVTPFVIAAGWEIPARLEQAINSDLPGELKALVTANVYDTATGQYLLIPQGSRLVGVYDSKVAYGQSAVQAVWHRVIFPDASSLDLSGMQGQDSQGNGGFSGAIDRHYARLIGFAALTSLMSAGLSITQNRNGSYLQQPRWQDAAASGAGEGLQSVSNQITSLNAHVAPTIKIPPGYRFNVRVSRDIILETPYEPLPPQTPGQQPSQK